MTMTLFCEVPEGLFIQCTDLFFAHAFYNLMAGLQALWFIS